MVGVFTFSLYSYKLPELDVKSIVMLTLLLFQIYLLLESLNRLTMRQIGGAFFGTLLFAVLPWTHNMVVSGVFLSEEFIFLFCLLMALSYRFTRSLDFLVAGLVMLIMLIIMSCDLSFHIFALICFLLLTEHLINREINSKRSIASLGFFSILLFIGLGYSWFTQTRNTEVLLSLLGGFALILLSFLGYSTIKGYWMQRSLFLLALFVLTLCCVGTFYFPLFLTLAVLFILGLLPRFWMKYPFVGGFIYCCWESWAV